MALTKIKGAGINISAAEKLYFDGGGTTYIQESADGVLDFYADNVKMLELLEGGTDYVWVPVDATKLAIGAGKDLNIYTSSDDAIIENITSDKDIIFKGNDGGGTITALTLDISAAGAATFNDKIIATELDISGNMDIDGTSNLDAVDIDGAVQIDSTVTVGADDQGYDVIFYGNTASSNMTWDTSEDDLVLNDSRLFIDQDDNATAFSIDAESTTADIVSINGDATTDGTCFRIDADGLEDGTIALFQSDSDDNSGRNLVKIVNDNASAVATTLLALDQDADHHGMTVDTAATGGFGIYVEGNALTTGALANFYSNSSSGTARNLVLIDNDNASADATACLRINQDGDGPAISLIGSGGGGIKFQASAQSSSDANTLDDYEEGTWTPTLLGTSSNPTQSYSDQVGRYTKIGRMVYFQCRVVMASSGITPGSGLARLGALPFTSLSTANTYGGLNVEYSSGWLTHTGAPSTGYTNPNDVTADLQVYDNDAGNVAGTTGCNAADIDENTDIIVRGFYTT